MKTRLSFAIVLATSCALAAADWQAAAKSDDVEHTLQATVIDKTGTVPVESAPLSFYPHRTTVRREKR